MNSTSANPAEPLTDLVCRHDHPDLVTESRTPLDNTSSQSPLRLDSPTSSDVMDADPDGKAPRPEISTPFQDTVTTCDPNAGGTEGGSICGLNK